MIEDNTHVIKGLPPLGPIPDGSVGKLIYDKLLSHCVEDEAMVDAFTERSISYKELFAKTCSLAESLRRSGYKQDAVISVCSENCVEYFIPIISALYLGIPVAPINNNYTKAEVLHSLNIAKPQLIFCSKETYPKFVDLKRQLSFIEKIIIIDSKSDISGLECVDSFIRRCLQTNHLLYKFDLPNIHVDHHVAFILYSSGTTGLPKGVMITHKNILVKISHSDDPRVSPQEEGRCTFVFLPFFHAYGLFVSLGSIYKAIRVVLIKKFEENLFLKTIEKYKITTLPLVPPLAVFLAKSPLVNKYDLSSVKDVGCGAAPLSKDTEEAVKKRLKVNIIRQAYGLTEATLAVIGMPTGVERHGSSGVVYPRILCKVRDPKTGKSLGPNQVGELCFKGPLIMKGYYGNAEATRNSFTSDGWLLTGDLGYYDEEKYFYITGRLKELIKYKGFQVAPAELESILLKNPKIKDVAVIGLPDEDAGELPLAFVVKDPKAELSEEEVQKFLEDKVSSHKRLRGGVIFISEIPKNASGKILRRKLHEMLKRYYMSKL